MTRAGKGVVVAATVAADVVVFFNEGGLGVVALLVGTTGDAAKRLAGGYSPLPGAAAAAAGCGHGRSSSRSSSSTPRDRCRSSRSSTRRPALVKPGGRPAGRRPDGGGGCPGCNRTPRAAGGTCGSR